MIEGQGIFMEHQPHTCLILKTTRGCTAANCHTLHNRGFLSPGTALALSSPPAKSDTRGSKKALSTS